MGTVAHVSGKPHVLAQPADRWMPHKRPKHPIQIRSMESCWIASRKICCCQVPGGESGGGSETVTVRMPSFETARVPGVPRQRFGRFTALAEPTEPPRRRLVLVSSTQVDPVPLTVPDSVDSPSRRRRRVPHSEGSHRGHPAVEGGAIFHDLTLIDSSDDDAPFTVPGSGASPARPSRRLVLVPGSVDARTTSGIQDRECGHKTPNIQATVHVSLESVAEPGNAEMVSGPVPHVPPADLLDCLEQESQWRGDDSQSFENIGVGGRRSAMPPNPNVNRFRHRECGFRSFIEQCRGLV